MSSQPSRHSDGAAPDTEISALYHELLECWNRRSAQDYAALFAENGSIVGFDGSQVNGQAEIERHIGQVFADHQTATYVGAVREVRWLAPDVALLRAVVGMIAPGQAEINPAANAIQSLVATKPAGSWRIALFQNTPAQFHGRPDLTEQLTDELRQLARQR